MSLTVKMIISLFSLPRCEGRELLEGKLIFSGKITFFGKVKR